MLLSQISNSVLIKEFNPEKKTIDVIKIEAYDKQFPINLKNFIKNYFNEEWDINLLSSEEENNTNLLSITEQSKNLTLQKREKLLNCDIVKTFQTIFPNAKIKEIKIKS